MLADARRRLLALALAVMCAGSMVPEARAQAPDPTEQVERDPARLDRAGREALSRDLDRAAGRAPLAEPQAPGPRPEGYGSLLLKLVISLGAVCLLAYLAIRFGLKRLMPDASRGGKMEVLGRLPLEPRRTLLVVRVGKKHLVLASSEAGVHPVAELSADEAAAFTGEEPIPTAFTLEVGEAAEDEEEGEGESASDESS